MSTASVRYIVEDVSAAIPFYEQLGFEVRMRPAPGFATLVKDDLQLLLSQPSSGGAGQEMPDGSKPEPGGWNRIQMVVDDLEATVNELRRNGITFRNDIVVGKGGKQTLAQDPSGNLVELFEPAARTG